MTDFSITRFDQIPTLEDENVSPSDLVLGYDSSAPAGQRNRLFRISGLLETHKIDPDAHPGYLTLNEIAPLVEGKENTGTAAAAIAQHNAAPDPHTQYLTVSEVVALYGQPPLRSALPPTSRLDGALVEGDLWIRTGDFTHFFWNGNHWLSEKVEAFTFQALPSIDSNSTLTIIPFARYPIFLEKLDISYFLNVQSVEQSLFSTQTPNDTNISDATSNGTSEQYELGMKFSSARVGNIDAIRYYKAANETGSHVGKIWSSTGQLLASVTFTNEIASGWQQQALTTPLTIQPNTTYVVSVNVNSHYAVTPNGLSSTLTNGDLSAVADGSNGVFNTDPGSFPTQSFNNSNYFRDIVFTPTASSSINSIELSHGNTHPIVAVESGTNNAFTVTHRNGNAIDIQNIVANASSFRDSVDLVVVLGELPMYSISLGIHAYHAASTYQIRVVLNGETTLEEATFRLTCRESV